MKSLHASALLTSAVTGLTASLVTVTLARSTARDAGDEDLEELSEQLVRDMELFNARVTRLVRSATTMADHPFVPRTTSDYCARCPRRAAYHPGQD